MKQTNTPIIKIYKSKNKSTKFKLGGYARKNGSQQVVKQSHHKLISLPK